jgi:hypothetical protein
VASHSVKAEADTYHCVRHVRQAWEVVVKVPAVEDRAYREKTVAAEVNYQASSTQQAASNKEQGARSKEQATNSKEQPSTATVGREARRQGGWQTGRQGFIKEGDSGV